MLQVKTEIINEVREFDWISCASNSAHVMDFLVRFLRFVARNSLKECAFVKVYIKSLKP